MRTRLYHSNHPEGKIFTDELELSHALTKGWVEAPWLIHEVRDAIEKRKIAENHISEHKGDDFSRSSTKTGSSGSTKQRKKPGRKTKNEG